MKLVSVALAALSAVAGITGALGENVTVIQTAETIPSKDKPDRLAKYVFPVESSPKEGVMTLDVDITKKFQTIKGLAVRLPTVLPRILKLKPKLQREVLGLCGEKLAKSTTAATIGATDF